VVFPSSIPTFFRIELYIQNRDYDHPLFIPPSFLRYHRIFVQSLPLNYIREHNTDSIKYTTSREIQAGEELCIFYGADLWFEESVSTKNHHSQLWESEDEGDPFPKMIGLDFGMDVEDPRKVIPEEELPFEALDINDFAQEEDLESVRTGE